jgi:hypothetical protein
MRSEKLGDRDDTDAADVGDDDDDDDPLTVSI